MKMESSALTYDVAATRRNLSISLHGCAFTRNFGDLLLLDIVQNWIREISPKFEIAVPFARQNVLSAIQQPLAGGATKFPRTRNFIYYGGGYFWVNQHFGLLRRIKHHLKYTFPGMSAQLLGMRSLVLGVGVGPLLHYVDRKVLRLIFESVDAATVRDEEGLRELRSIGVKNKEIESTADIALSIKRDDIPSSYLKFAADHIKNPKLKGLNLIGLHLSGSSVVSQAYREILYGVKKFAEAHPEIHFIIFCDHITRHANGKSEQELAADEAKLMLGERATRLPEMSHWQIVAIIGHLNGIITNKLHTGIVSAALGVTPASIAKHDKNFRFYKQIGLPENCISIGNISEINVERYLERSLERSSRPFELPCEVREASMRNKNVLSKFLQSCN